MRLIVLLSVVVVLSCAACASYTGDPHWINRSGALVAAIGALAALKVALLGKENNSNGAGTGPSRVPHALRKVGEQAKNEVL